MKQFIAIAGLVFFGLCIHAGYVLGGQEGAIAGIFVGLVVAGFAKQIIGGSLIAIVSTVIIIGLILLVKFIYS